MVKSENYRGLKLLCGFLLSLLFIYLLRTPAPIFDSENRCGVLALSPIPTGRTGHSPRGGLIKDCSVETTVSPVKGRPEPPRRGGLGNNNIPFISMQGNTTAHREAAEMPNPRLLGQVEDGDQPGGRRSDAGRPALIINNNRFSRTRGLPAPQGSPLNFTDDRQQTTDDRRQADWLDELLDKIQKVESGGQTNPPDGDNGRAVGPLQIHNCVLTDVNRFYGTNFKDEDRSDEEKSRIIARLYISMWFEIHREEIAALIFHYGPSGWRKKDVHGYWEKIKKMR